MHYEPWYHRLVADPNDALKCFMLSLTKLATQPRHKHLTCLWREHSNYAQMRVSFERGMHPDALRNDMEKFRILKAELPSSRPCIRQAEKSIYQHNYDHMVGRAPRYSLTSW